MKKFAAYLLSALTAVSLTACGGQQGTSAAPLPRRRRRNRLEAKRPYRKAEARRRARMHRRAQERRKVRARREIPLHRQMRPLRSRAEIF